jgi:hypothetical protein
MIEDHPTKSTFNMLTCLYNSRFSVINNPVNNRRLFMPAKFILPPHIKLGSRVSRWTLLELPILGRDKILCRCDCGKELRVNIQNIIRGLSKSCRSCSVRRHATTHGESDHTGNTRLYRIWKAMKWRCNPKNTHDAGMYNGRGITVCEEWSSSYVAFRDWALAHGYADNLSIDRHPDMNGNYQPNNCRWATSTEQCRNTRRNRQIEAFGEAKSCVEWAEDPRCNNNHGALKRRLELGWPAEEAITMPVMKGMRYACR